MLVFTPGNGKTIGRYGAAEDKWLRGKKWRWKSVASE